MPKTAKVKIVMVEDDEGHAMLIKKNFERAGLSNSIKHFTDGKDALDFFMKDADEVSNKPYLILLDLNLPSVDGFEILQKLKSKENTSRIPVIILTTTDNPKEVERCYKLGCNAYLTKPVDYNSFSECIKKLGLFLAVVKVPNE